LRATSIISQFTVAPVGDGDIEVPLLTGANGKPKRWQGIGPLTFQERGGQDKLVFKPDQQGHMQMILPFPFFVGQRVGTLQSGKLLLTVLIISLVLMLITLILWPVAWGVRKHYGARLDLSPAERLLRLGVRLVFVLDLVFFISLFSLMVYGLLHLEVFNDHTNTWIHLIQIIGVLGAVGTLLALVNAFLAWTNGRRRIWSKLQATVLLLACLGALWFAFAGNLLHFSSTF
jgi:uncharacterized membrane protein